MKRLLIAMLACGAAQAAPPVSPGARLAATCAACHGTAGATQGNTLPPLAGQDGVALAAALRAFRDGTRPSTIMQQIAKGYSEEQVAQVSAYLAAQKGRP